MNKYLDNLKQKFNEDNSDLPLIRFESFEKIPFIEHGFTTRLGGVSNEIMKKVKSIVMKVLAMMGENEVRAWGIGIK